MKKLTTLLSKEKLEIYFSKFIYYILPAIIFILLTGTVIFNLKLGQTRQETLGNLGWIVLSVVLFIKPISFLSKKYLKAESITFHQFILTLKNLPKTITKNHKEIKEKVIKKQLVPFTINSIYSISSYLIKLRKQLGLAAFRLLFTHAIFWQISRLRQGLSFGFNILETKILSGILAIIILAIVAITSNNNLIKKLKKNRKKIQMLSYIAFFFGGIHTGNTGLLLIYFVLKYIERKDTGILSTRKNYIINKSEILVKKIQKFAKKIISNIIKEK